MLAFQQMISGRPFTRRPVNEPPSRALYPSCLSNHPTSLGALKNLSTARRSASASSGVASPPLSSSQLSVSREPTPAPETFTNSQEDQATIDRRVVELELENYIQDGVLELKSSEIVRFWQVCLLSDLSASCADSVFNLFQGKANKYPTLYRIAMDVLPAQASAVPCERAFSSSKETLTKRRNKLSPALVEALQHLKFLVRQERLNFTIEQEVTEDELSIEECKAQMVVTREIMRNVLESNSPDALTELLADVDG